ncbi:MAG: flavodoxin family protein [Chitinivibrionales bacterium]|nr:flavodoxin family protein [Chitinivibrionales bacterium]MBD3356358.1 flavodoxin family protein [Chitinivibrionales bacterium]
MKALLINGSPREGSNTGVLLQHASDVLEREGIECEIQELRQNTIHGCIGCAACRKSRNAECPAHKDDFGPILAKMIAADIIITGSPVYFGSATPELMALLDRAGYVSRGNGNLFSRKVGGPLAVARRAGHNFTYAQQLYWFTINDMIVPGSTYWNIGFGSAAGSVSEDEEGIRTIERFAANCAWVAHKVAG